MLLTMFFFVFVLQLGDGTNSSRRTPVTAVGLNGGVASLALGMVRCGRVLCARVSVCVLMLLFVCTRSACELRVFVCLSCCREAALVFCSVCFCERLLFFWLPTIPVACVYGGMWMRSWESCGFAHAGMLL